MCILLFNKLKHIDDENGGAKKKNPHNIGGYFSIITKIQRKEKNKKRAKIEVNIFPEQGCELKTISI